ncbi:MAG: DNA-binding response OmpR family regulator [Akkermansiaceae bacterium]|jgi:DNA-binding response OmpR family regulator
MKILLTEDDPMTLEALGFLDRCWGMDYFPDSRTLDQHVHMLRKKIGSDPEIIERVRCVGYRYRG